MADEPCTVSDRARLDQLTVQVADVVQRLDALERALRPARSATDG